MITKLEVSTIHPALPAYPCSCYVEILFVCVRLSLRPRIKPRLKFKAEARKMGIDSSFTAPKFKLNTISCKLVLYCIRSLHCVTTYLRLLSLVAAS